MPSCEGNELQVRKETKGPLMARQSRQTLLRYRRHIHPRTDPQPPHLPSMPLQTDHRPPHLPSMPLQTDPRVPQTIPSYERNELQVRKETKGSLVARQSRQTLLRYRRHIYRRTDPRPHHLSLMPLQSDPRVPYLPPILSCTNHRPPRLPSVLLCTDPRLVHLLSALS